MLHLNFTSFGTYTGFINEINHDRTAHDITDKSFFCERKFHRIWSLLELVRNKTLETILTRDLQCTNAKTRVNALAIYMMMLFNIRAEGYKFTTKNRFSG